MPRGGTDANHLDDGPLPGRADPPQGRRAGQDQGLGALSLEWIVIAGIVFAAAVAAGIVFNNAISAETAKLP